MRQVEHKIGRNFNLLVSLPDNRTLLVKQECYAPGGKTSGGFLNEWQIQKFLQEFPALSHLRLFTPEVLDFNPEHSIIVFNYLKDYRDLMDFYIKENVFPTTIASTIGAILAEFHRATFNRQDYGDFFSQERESVPVNGGIPHIIRKFDRISPDVFGQVPADGLKFFALYQRYERLRIAIAQLTDSIEPCCLTHNDMKLNNILLHDDWEQTLQEETPSGRSIIRLIDWERCSWGDPAFDVGMLIGSYLLLWLKSLVVSKSIAIEDSLRMAVTPLEQVQPSIVALASAYFSNFPEILECRPQFLHRVMQFSGLALILQIQSTLQHQKTFGNAGICMLQVAKGLLCRPEQSITTVFGTTASEITGLRPAFA
ncbi:MAG TPA: phosphotransferase [Stenomitos sp.]